VRSTAARRSPSFAGPGRIAVLASLAVLALPGCKADDGAAGESAGLNGATDCAPGPLLSDALRAYYDAHGGAEGFSAPYRAVMDTSVLAWDDLQSCDPAAAQQRLAALFGDLPRGSAAWDSVTNERGGQVDTPPGLTVASMLARVADARVEKKPGAPTAPLRITVAIAACSRGVVPANQAELTGPVDGGAGGGGTTHTAEVDPALLADDFAVLRQSLSVFQAYVEALFGGRATAEVQFAPLPADRCVDVLFEWSNGRPFARPSPGAVHDMIAAAPPDALGRTDWWQFIYPTLLPDDPNDFDSNEWVTGGSTSGPHGEVLNLVDDQWFLRQPPHFVSQPHTPFPRVPYQEIERFFYLPRWLTHETHHHFFGYEFPEAKLEEPPGSHSWFDRSTWPADFVGRFEQDYFDQADFLRFQTATPPIWVRARYSFDWGAIADVDLVGRYEACRLPEWSDNDYLWNKGSIALTDGHLTWTNDAGVSWRLASWREDASVPPGSVRLVDGPYPGQLWKFTQDRDPGTGAGIGVVGGFDGHMRCPTTGCVCK
jgi:hypothetical protein